MSFRFYCLLASVVWLLPAVVYKVLITNAPEITQVMPGFEGVLYSFFISSIIVGWLKK